MTDPQLPPPQPYGSVPPVPPAPGTPGASGTHDVPGYPASAAGYAAPAGAYAAPVGGYRAPEGAYQAPQPATPRSAVMGVVSFVLSLVAAAIAPIIGGIAGYQIGFRLPSVMADVDTTASDLSYLAPVRDQVLMGEIGFWVGTLAGIAAIVFGIIAIAKRQGRVWGIVALILAVIGPVIFFMALSIALGIGASAGAVSTYGS